MRERDFRVERTSRSRFRSAFLLAAAAVFFLLPARAEIGPGQDPHAHFRNPEFCSRCHLRVDGKTAPDRFVGDADAFCLQCHRSKAAVRSHPRKVRPKDSLRTTRAPAEFRLDEEANIMCLTCHKGHGEFLSDTRSFPGQRPEEAVSSGGPRRFRTFYMRRSDPVRGFAPLCAACHSSL